MNSTLNLKSYQYGSFYQDRHLRLYHHGMHNGALRSRSFSNKSVSWSYVNQKLENRFAKDLSLDLRYDSRYDYVNVRHVHYHRTGNRIRLVAGGDMTYTRGNFDYQFMPNTNDAGVERPGFNRILFMEQWTAELFGTVIIRPAENLTLNAGTRAGYHLIAGLEYLIGNATMFSVEVHAVDYLLKPVRKERLKESVERAAKNYGTGLQSETLQKLVANREPAKKNQLLKIPVNYKREIRLVGYNDIRWFEADGKITWVHTTDGKITWVHTTDEKKYLCDFSLGDLEQRLDQTSFQRIHRSAIVNLDHVEKMEPWFQGGYRITLNGGVELEVARRRLDDLKKRLGF